MIGRAEKADSSKLSIIAFGDSITEGTYGGANKKETFPFVLENMLSQKQIDSAVTNQGLPGETAPEALQRIQKDVIDLKPDIALVMYGANDAYTPPGFNEPAVSIAQFTESMHQMVNMIQEASILPVLMTSTPLSDLYFSTDDDEAYRESIKKTLDTYMDVVRKLALEKQILLVDHHKIWLGLNKVKNILNTYLPDGVHPNAAGNYFLAIVIYQALVNQIRK